ncbi:MAG: MobF family relaxase [Acidimicrobiales bacterium]
MLTCCKVSGDRVGYYLDVTASGADHPDGLVEPDGVWKGAGNSALGLIGTATPDEVRAVLSGVHPATGELLQAGPERRRIAAFDLTFSTPKTVSILHVLSKLAGDAEASAQVSAAHDSAVAATLGYLEGVAACCVLGGSRDRQVVEASGLLAVGFLHHSSRAPDPHLHTHLLVANLVFPRDGGPARPLDARSLYAEVRAAGALYEAHLRVELTRRLGVEWEVTTGSWADIKGFPVELKERFSRRAIEITTEAKEKGWTSRPAMNLIALRTKRPKDLRISRRELEAMWDRVRLACGVSDERIRSVMGRVDGAAVLAREQADWKDQALRSLLSANSTGTFGRREAIVARCSASTAGIEVAVAVADVDDLLLSAAVVHVRHEQGRLRAAGVPGVGRIPTGRTEDVYTATTLLEAASRVNDLATELGDSLSVISYGPGERVATLDGLSCLACQWAAPVEGRRAVGLAPSRWAAASFEAATGIETFERPGRQSRTGGPDLSRLESGSVVVVAEAQGYGPLALEDIFRTCHSTGASVMLVGSDRGLAVRPELRAVKASGPAELGFRQAAGEGEGVWPVVRFGETTAVGVPTLAAGLHELSRLGEDGSLVVTADAAVLEFLRRDVSGDLPPGAAALRRDVPGKVEPGGVTHLVHAKGLNRLLESMPVDETSRTPVVILGGTSSLRKVVGRADGVDRTHVVVVPQLARWSHSEPLPDEVVGRLAEATRPAYLVKALKRAGRDPATREAWRRGAVLVEEWRGRHGVTDSRNPFGVERPSAGAKSAYDERVEDQRSVQRQLKALGFVVTVGRGGERDVYRGVDRERGGPGLER